MYIPTFQGLAAADLVRPASDGASRFPFDAPHRLFFYRARNAIYHLFRALLERRGRLVVLAPDYNSGNEVLAMQAAGVTLRYYPVRPDAGIDLDALERIYRATRPDVLYVIHYLGWPQPVEQLASWCRRDGAWLVEDCALALLSHLNGRPLGSFGDWAIFCLYKTLPVPNGAVLVQNGARLAPLERLAVRRPGLPSVAGRTAELVVERVRSRRERVGSVLQSAKRALGAASRAVDGNRAPVGDIGFSLSDVDLAMSRLSARIANRQDFDAIRRRRVRNFRQLAARLAGRIPMLRDRIADDGCPLVLPILVADKRASADFLRRQGIEALEFWNEGAAADVEGPASRHLRAHVLGLPIHQDLTPEHITYMSQHVSNLEMRMAS